MKLTELKDGEVVKEIKGFPHYYISNFGRTFSDYPSKKLGKGFRELRQRNHPTGYKYVGLYHTDDDGIVRRYWKRVHRLVWAAFNGNLQRKLVVDHKDENKSNNHIDNLQAITHRNNVIKSIQYKKSITV